jgi:hypothetical protein
MQATQFSLLGDHITVKNTVSVSQLSLLSGKDYQAMSEFIPNARSMETIKDRIIESLIVLKKATQTAIAFRSNLTFSEVSSGLTELVFSGMVIQSQDLYYLA